MGASRSHLRIGAVLTAATPIALLVDDPTPFLHLYRHHMRDLHGSTACAADGRELAAEIPDAFLDRFVAVTRERGLAGKFSIVPAPEGRGDVARGIADYGAERTRRWVRTAVDGLGARFDFSPEMITHSWAVELATGKLLGENEHDWSQRQTRATLTPYVARGLALLQEAGVDATGVTSPWFFGRDVEPEYAAAILAAQRQVHGRELSWYFLHVREDPAARPEVALRDGGATLVSVPASMDDLLWDTIWKHGPADAAAVGALADAFLTADGRAGRVREVLDAGGWPVLLAHWQTLWSNGHETGLAVLDEVGARVARALGDAVRWSSCLELAAATAAATAE